MRLHVLVGLVLITACQAPAPPTPTSSPTIAPTVTPTSAPPAVTSSRVDTLNAANAAFASSDLTTATGLYERVVNTPPTGEQPDVASAVTSFAHFRAMVTLLAAGHEDEAHTHLDALQKMDPNAPFARLASQLWDQYGMIGQLRGACAQLQPQIVSQAGPTLATLQAAGATVDPATLCRA
jgi:hypothetical protein